jgi:hypothetical protein
MGTQARRPAGAVQWTHAAPGAEARTEAPTFGGAARDGGADGAATPLQELVGAMFSTPKELRHLAERELGELFVPVEVVAESAHCAVYTLHAGSLAPLLVHAERERHWYPFRVTRVEEARVHPRGSGGSPRGNGGEPAGLPAFGATRPAIDWL